MDRTQHGGSCDDAMSEPGGLFRRHIDRSGKSGMGMPRPAPSHEECRRAFAHELPVIGIERRPRRGIYAARALDHHIGLTLRDLAHDPFIQWTLARGRNGSQNCRQTGCGAQPSEVSDGLRDATPPYRVAMARLVVVLQLVRMLGIAKKQLQPRAKPPRQLGGLGYESMVGGTAVEDSQQAGRIIHMRLPRTLQPPDANRTAPTFRGFPQRTV